MDDELVKLETIYSSPGTLLLAANEKGERSGCVGLRPLGRIDGALTGEMRRLFVRKNHRNHGVGKLLVTTLISYARNAGFERIVLNTLPEMTTAHAVYTAFGFQPSDPHVEEPAEGTLYFSLDLTSGD